MRISLLCLVFLCSCTGPKNILSKYIHIQDFKDRALCDCLVIGVDSAKMSSQVQRLINYDPVAGALYDSAINVQLQFVMKKIDLDSVERITRKAESAQGRWVFESCMKYYNSKELDSLARRMLHKWRRQKNIEDYIHIKYPTW